MTTVVIMPGGFHPFHAGHLALYHSAQKAFPGAEVYVAATNDTSARPFPFSLKEKLAELAGVEPGHFVQVKSPFRAEEITSGFDPKRDQLIFVRSEKDAGKPPQAGGTKKDGSPAYLQPMAGTKKLQPFGKHAYMAYLPTVEFGPGMTSATEIRSAWPGLTPERKMALVMSLYPRTQGNRKLATSVVRLLNSVMSSTNENQGWAATYENAEAQDRTKQHNEKILDLMRDIARQDMRPEDKTAVINALRQQLVKDTDTAHWNFGSGVVAEAGMRNDPEQGHIIYPDGGLGGYSPETLQQSVNRHLVDAMAHLKSGEFDKVEYMLYQWGVLESKVHALKKYLDFMKRQGRRPIAANREVDLGEDYIAEI